MKHILSIVCYILSIFILLGCPSPISNSNMNYYLQQAKNAKDDSGGGPNIDWDDDDSDSGTDVVLPPGSISIFSALQPDGKVLTCATTAVAGKLGGPDASYTGYVYDTERFEKWKILGTFSAANVPYLNYNGDASWSAPSADGSNMQFFNGPNSNAGSNSITDMKYYRYKEVNPFFAPDSSYNTADFVVYNGEEETAKKEPLMKRFYFYRFSGKGGGVAPLDNMLVAVDTYTKLVFSFAKPTKWGSLLGNAVPLEWGPVDLCSTGPGGKKYKFYEYDPSGYVTEDGKFHMTDSYMSNQSSGNYDPDFTGKSPYLLGAINSDGSSSGGGDGGETGYTVSGALTVTAKYIKNISMTDAWGDRGNGDGVDSPEFIYSVRSRAYSGFETGEWNAMSYYKPNDSGMSPSGAKVIKKGATLLLGGGKEYVFDKIVSGLTLELDSRIIEIDIVGNDNLTDYETPVIFLGYDRYSQKWTPKANNDTYLRGPLEYDENFQVGLGETEDFIVTVPAGNGEKIELCYAISWKSDSNTDTGRIFSVQTKNKGTDYLFSGSNGIYDIEYIDLTEASSKEDKTVSIELILGNLHSEVPVVVDYEKKNVVSGFIGEPTFDGYNLAQAAITAAEPTLKIDIPLAYSPSNTQEGTLTLTFSDSSGALSTYDKDASPDKIVINIIRNKFIPINDAILAISNVKLKNLSVMDVGGDQPWGGYNQPEFSWNIKTRHNELEWKELSSNNGTNLIQTEQTRSLPGTVDHNIANPREGTQTIYFSAAITERDFLANNDDDVIMRHEQPLIKFGYNPLSDSWNLIGQTTFYFTDGKDMQWQIKKITMDDAVRDSDAQKVTVSLSAFINDTIWPSDNIADWVNGPITAGWGDMELTFDIEWISK